MKIDFNENSIPFSGPQAEPFFEMKLPLGRGEKFPGNDTAGKLIPIQKTLDMKVVSTGFMGSPPKSLMSSRVPAPLISLPVFPDEDIEIPISRE